MKEAKLQSFRMSARDKYGFEVPKNFKNVEKLEEKNGTTKWTNWNKIEHQ